MIRLLLIAAAARFFASSTAAAHRIPLPAEAASARFDPLARTLEVRDGEGRLVRSGANAFATTPCRAERASLSLRCTTSRLAVSLREGRDGMWLDVRELRGLPEDDPVPPFSYTCADDRADCTFLQLGDWAMARLGPDAAIGLWRKAGEGGDFGRLAQARLCEVTGACLSDPLLRAFDSAKLPEPLRTEMELRSLRTLALLARWPEVLDKLAALFPSGECGEGERAAFCLRLALAAFDAPERPAEKVMSVYLAIPHALDLPQAALLAREAARAAGEMGAPAYGAALLGATLRVASRETLRAHLKQAYELYLDAGDPVRAGVIADYARIHLRGRALEGWTPLPHAPEAAAPFDEGLARAELAVAASSLVRARRRAGDLK